MPSIHCWVLNVKEINSKAKDKLEWKLLCSRQINNLSDALECIEQYKHRWLIEEYHKAIKTGLGAEKLQLESAHALFSAISIMNIVALRLIDLREKVKEQANVFHCNEILSALEIKILEMKTGKKINTYREILFSVGQLGGFLGRKGDGTPGMITLWRGMNTLRLMIEGYLCIERLILAPMRHITFTSIAEINAAIKPRLAAFNQQSFQKMKTSRLALFQAVDQPVLKPLPRERYQYADWQRAKIHIDYHFVFDDHYYSVPFKYIHQEVER